MANDTILALAGFGDMVKLRKEQKCPFCNKSMKDAQFRDELSRKEYRISGLCQECQDKTFGGE